MLQKGDKINFPKKGDTVHCWYTGTLEDGTVFDSNVASGKQPMEQNILRYDQYVRCAIVSCTKVYLFTEQIIVHICSVNKYLFTEY